MTALLLVLAWGPDFAAEDLGIHLILVRIFMDWERAPDAIRERIH